MGYDWGIPPREGKGLDGKSATLNVRGSNSFPAGAPQRLLVDRVSFVVIGSAGNLRKDVMDACRCSLWLGAERTARMDDTAKCRGSTSRFSMRAGSSAGAKIRRVERCAGFPPRVIMDSPFVRHHPLPRSLALADLKVSLASVAHLSSTFR